MKKLLTLSLVLVTFGLNAQLADGSTSPNFSLDDLDGVNHDLYDYLDEGYSAILDFSATWCGPCWSYHQTGILEDMWSDYGPDGEDKVMVFMIEADPATSYDCIYGSSGCSGGSIGDWTAGVDYPILNPEAGDAAEVNADFAINYFPTLYGVAPNGEIYELAQTSYSEWESWTAFSFQMHNTTWETNDDDCTESFIDLTPVGGEGNIDFEWSNGATTEDLFNIAPGTYMVTMTDDNNYEVVKGPIEVENNNGADIELIDLGNVSCNGGSDGFIEVEADSPSGDLEFEWSNGATTSFLEDVPAGEYDLTITDMATGCEFDFEYEVEEPDELEFEYEVENPDCDDQVLGYVEFDVDGGTWPLTFVFEDFDTREEYIELEPGEYEPTITDANGCELIVPQFEIVATDAPVAMSQAIGQFNCLTDTVMVSADNSSSGPNFEYFWYDPSYVLVGTTDVVQVDSAGMYTLEVHNTTNDCVTSSSVMVMEDYNVPIAVANALGSIDCNNSSTMLSAMGSTSDSSSVFTWSTIDGSILSPVNQQDIEVSAAGTYTLTVDNIYSGCFSTASIQIEVEDIPELEILGENEFCQGASTTICITENGGELPTWSVNGVVVSNNFCLDVEEAVVIDVVLTNENTGCQSQDIIETFALDAPSVLLEGELNLCEGNVSTLCLDNPNGHNVIWDIDGTLTQDVNCVDVSTTSNIDVMMTNMSTGCQTSETFTSVVSANPTLIIDSANVLDCTNSSSLLNLTTNGTEISWYDQSNLLIATEQSVSVTEAGMYTAVVTNEFGCQASQSVMVEANLDELPVANYQYMAADYTFTFEDMSTGNIIERTWDFGDGNTSSDANPTHTYAGPGFYDVKLVTTNDCGTSTKEEEVLATTALQLTTISSNVTCNGLSDASIQVILNGGLPGYTYEWITPEGSVLTDSNISNLNAGSYKLLITDSAGAQVEEEVEIVEPSILNVEGSVTNSPSTSTEGAIELVVDGGTAPYTFLWSNGSTEMNQTDLAQGEYSVVVTDSNGCESDVTYTVTGTTNVSEIEFIDVFEISPNPAVNFIDINIELKQKNPLQITMLALDGKVVQRFNVDSKSVSQRIMLNDVSNGIYLIELRSTNNISMKKVIVAK